MSIDADKLDQEADAEFEALLNGGAPSEEDSAQPVEEPTPAPAPADSAPDEAPEVDDKADERVKNAQALMTKATQEAAETRRQNEQLSQQLQQALKEVEALKVSATPQTPEEPNANIRSLQDLASEYPDLLGPVIGELQSLREAVNSTEQTAQQSQQAVKQTQQTASQQAHERAILEQHPDAFDVAATDDFKGWLLRQPPASQAIVKQGTAQDVIWLIGSYKQQSTAQPSKLDKAKEVADPQVQSRAPSIDTASPALTAESIAAMSNEEFEKHEKEIDAFYAKGALK
jgi:hypothetical protein